MVTSYNDINFTGGGEDQKHWKVSSVSGKYRVCGVNGSCQPCAWAVQPGVRSWPTVPADWRMRLAGTLHFIWPMEKMEKTISHLGDQARHPWLILSTHSSQSLFMGDVTQSFR